jgi:class 3 adenylate cyclase
VERKVATVLFADLVGSTELGEQDPERTRALLDRFYTAMADEVERAGGTVEKFAGDAVMAAFGAPAALEDHAERALHAALAMQNRVGEIDRRLELRIGVNTGDVVVDEQAKSSFVTGDAVNVCARLEQNAEPGEILVGERTAQAARGAFEFGEPATIEAKGKRDGVVCRRLVRALSLMRPRGVGVLSGAFVGRDRELELLRTTYERAVELREPHLVTIAGDAGVGKTRLVRELWEWLGARPEEPLRRTGRCLAYGQGITYWPIGEVLKEHFGVLESDAPQDVRRRLGDEQQLGLALGLDPGDVHPLAVRDRFHDAWVDFATSLAASRPTVLLIEDVHWAEEPLLGLLDRTVREATGALLLVVTTRPDAEWTGTGRNVTTIHIEPLARRDAAQMLAGLPDQARELVLTRAEGNPFFVEELVAALIDRGALERANGGWALTADLDELSVPDSVRGVLAARIDLLPPGEKAALQAAALIGRVFWERALLELLGTEAVDLALLEDRDFVRRRSGSSMTGEREYAVKHALTREVAYGTLPKAKRAQMHAAFARWLEQLDGREELAPLLAHHYAEAVRPEDADLAWANAETELTTLQRSALEWLRKAAEQALSRYDIDDALALLEQALPLASTGGERLVVWRSIARAQAFRYAGDEFWEAMQRAIAEASDPADEGELYAELVFQTAIRSGIWRRMPDRGLVDEWIERALALAPPDSEARARTLIAQARWDPAKGGIAAVEASAIAERLGNVELRAAAWDARGIASFVAGEFDHGRAWAERRFELLDEISDPDIRADIYAAPITGCIWSGRFNEARRLARAHDEIASKLTPHHRMHGVAIDVEVEELLGRWDTVRELQGRTEGAVAENLATPCIRNPRTLLVCALANELNGDSESARRLEEQAHELWMDGYGLTLDTPRLRLALARRDEGAVEELLARPDTAPGWHRGWFVFANISTRLDGLGFLGDRRRVEDEAPHYIRRTGYLEPFALRALGRVREDEQLLERARERFEAMGLDWQTAETRALLV